HLQRASTPLVFPRARSIADDTRLAVVEALDLEQCRGTADFVERSGLTKHEPFAAQRREVVQHLEEMIFVPTQLVLEALYVVGGMIPEEFIKETKTRFELAALFRGVEYHVAHFFPGCRLVLTADDTHRLGEGLSCHPEFAVERNIGKGGEKIIRGKKGV